MMSLIRTKNTKRFIVKSEISGIDPDIRVKTQNPRAGSLLRLLNLFWGHEIFDAVNKIH